MDGVQPEFDREAWAEIIRTLKAEHNLSTYAFATRCGLNERSVRNWLKGLTPASEESVRKVARAFDLNPSDLLVKVGYYSENEVASRPIDDDLQFWVKLLHNPEVPDRVKRIAAAQLSVARRAVEEFAQTLGVEDIG